MKPWLSIEHCGHETETKVRLSCVVIKTWKRAEPRTIQHPDVLQQMRIEFTNSSCNSRICLLDCEPEIMYGVPLLIMTDAAILPLTFPPSSSASPESQDITLRR